MGSFSVLIANVGVLTVSSVTVSIAHSSHEIRLTVVTAALGMWFMFNQLDETYSALESDGVTELTGTLIILYVHLSHLVLSLTGFIVILTSPHSESSFYESLIELTIAY